MKEKLIFVKLAGMLFIGQEDPSNNKILIEPRMVFSNQEDRTINLAPCVGSPDYIVFWTDPEFSYENKDADFAEFYWSHVTPETEPDKKATALTIVK